MTVRYLLAAAGHQYEMFVQAVNELTDHQSYVSRKGVCGGLLFVMSGSLPEQLVTRYGLRVVA